MAILREILFVVILTVLSAGIVTWIYISTTRAINKDKSRRGDNDSGDNGAPPGSQNEQT